MQLLVPKGGGSLSCLVICVFVTTYHFMLRLVFQLCNARSSSHLVIPCQEEVARAQEVLPLWDDIDIGDALELLSKSFWHHVPRQYAVHRLMKVGSCHLSLRVIIVENCCSATTPALPCMLPLLPLERCRPRPPSWPCTAYSWCKPSSTSPTLRSTLQEARVKGRLLTRPLLAQPGRALLGLQTRLRLNLNLVRPTLCGMAPGCTAHHWLWGRSQDAFGHLFDSAL